MNREDLSGYELGDFIFTEGIFFPGTDGICSWEPMDA